MISDRIEFLKILFLLFFLPSSIQLENYILSAKLWVSPELTLLPKIVQAEVLLEPRELHLF